MLSLRHALFLICLFYMSTAETVRWQKIGQTEVLTCVSEDKGAAATVVWTKSTSGSAPSDTTSNTGFVYTSKITTPVLDKNSGSIVYTCTYTYGGVSSDTSAETFKVLPIALAQDGGVDVLQGTASTLTCKISDSSDNGNMMMNYVDSVDVWWVSGSTVYKSTSSGVSVSVKGIDGTSKASIKNFYGEVVIPASLATADATWTCRLFVDYLDDSTTQFDQNILLKTFTMTPNPASTEIKSGATVDISCVVAGIQTTYSTWFNKGSVSTKLSSLTSQSGNKIFTHTTDAVSADGTAYSCHVEPDSGGIYSVTYNIDVFTVVVADGKEVMVGSTSTMTCTVGDTTQSASDFTFKWIKSDATSTEYDTSTNGGTKPFVNVNGYESTLTIGSAYTWKTDDSTDADTIWTCKVTYGGNEFASSAVNVKTFTWVPQFANQVYAGQTATMSCLIGDNTATGTYKWVKGGSDVSGASTAKLTKIESTKGTYNYVCVVTVDGEEYSKDTYFNVFSITNTDALAKQGVAATLTAQVEGFLTTNHGKSQTITAVKWFATSSASGASNPVDITTLTGTFTVGGGTSMTQTLVVKSEQIVYTQFKLQFGITDGSAVAVASDVFGSKYSDPLTHYKYTVTPTTKERVDSQTATLTCTIAGAISGSATTPTTERDKVTVEWKAPNGQMYLKSGSYSGFKYTDKGSGAFELEVSSPTVDEDWKCITWDDSRTNGIDMKAETTAELDTYSITAVNFEAMKGAAGTLTCKIAGVDKAISSKWVNAAGQIISSGTSDTGAISGGNWNTLLLVSSGVTTDTQYTCQITVDSVVAPNVVARLHVFDITTFYYSTQKSYGTVLTCLITSLETISTSIKWNDGTQDITAATSITGKTVENSAISTSGEQTSKLTVDGAQVQSDLTYKCTVTVNGNAFFKDIASDVFDTSIETKEVMVGTQGVLTCKISGLASSVTPKAHWSKTTTDFYSVSRGGSNPLYVVTDPVKDSSTGVWSTKLTLDGTVVTSDETYTCQVEIGTDHKFSTDAHLKTFVITPISVEAQVGRATTVTCVVTDTTMASDAISWFKGSLSGAEYKQSTTTAGYTVIEGKRESEIQKTLLNIGASVNVGDESYLCKVTHDGADFSQTATLSTFSVVSSTVGAMVNNDATLTCKFSSLTTTSTTIEWVDGSGLSEKIYDYSNNDVNYLVTDSPIVSGEQTSTFKINGDYVKADKVYTCRMTIEGKSYDTEAETEIFVVTGKTTQYKTGDAVTLSCIITGLDVDSTAIKWGKENTLWVSTNNPDHTDFYVTDGTPTLGEQITTLKITATENDGDDDAYTCYVAAIIAGSSNPGPYYQVEVSMASFAVAASNNEVLVGHSATLTCTGTSVGASTTVVAKWSLSSTSWVADTPSNDGYSVVSTRNGETFTTELRLEKSVVTGDKTFTCTVYVDDVSSVTTASLKTYTAATTSHDVLVSNAATITCTLSGLQSAPSLIEWELPDKSTKYKSSNTGASGFVVSDGSLSSESLTTTLTIPGTKVTGDATYIVYITVDGVVSSQTVPLNTFSIQTSSQEKRAGDKVKMSCKLMGIEGSSALNVAWTDGSTTYNVGTLNGVTVVQGSLNGGEQETTLEINVSADKTFTCKVTSSGGTYATTVQQNVFEITSSSKEVMLGEKATLTCTIAGLVDTAQVTSTKFIGHVGTGNTKVEIMGGSTEENYLSTVTKSSNVVATLEIDGVITAEGDDTWTCSFEIEGSDYTEDITLNTFMITTVYYDSEKGQADEISCKVEGMSGSGNAAIKWSTESQDYTSSSSSSSGYTVLDGTNSGGKQTTALQISAALTDANDRAFTCQVQVDGVYFMKTINKKWFEISVDGLEVTAGQDSTITCKVDWLDKAPKTVVWSIDGDTKKYYSKDNDTTPYTVAYDTSTFDDNKIESTIVTVKPTDDKFYWCHVQIDDSNKIFTKRGSMHVFVIETHDVAVIKGQTTSLSCSITEYTSATLTSTSHVKWYKSDGSEVAGHTFSAQGTALTVSNAQEDDVYTCSVYIEGVWHKRTMKLDVFELLEVSDIVTSSEAATPQCVVHGLGLSVQKSISWMKETDFIIDSTGLLMVNTKDSAGVRRIGTVCKKNFDDNTAQGICNALGSQSAKHTSNKNYYYVAESDYDETTPIIYYDLVCPSNTASLDQCSTKKLTVDSSCGHDDDVILFCETMPQSPEITTGLSATHGVNSDTLTIAAGALTENKNYLCKLKLELGFGDQVFYGNELVNVDLIAVDYTNYVIPEGDKVTMTCIFKNLNSDHLEIDSYKWVSPGTTSTSNYNYDMENYPTHNKEVEASITAVQKGRDEGTWKCQIKFERSEELSITRLISKDSLLDIPDFVTTISMVTTEAGTTATYTCRGRKTSAARDITPIYTWTVKDVDRTSDSKLESSSSVLRVKATTDLDNSDAICTATYTGSDATTAKITSSAKLYAWVRTPLPHATVWSAVSTQVAMTCKYWSMINSAFVTGTTWTAAGSSIATSEYNTVKTADLTTSVLTLTNSQKTDEKTYTCVISFSNSIADVKQEIKLEKVFAITQQPVKNTPDMISGYSTDYSVTIEGDLTNFSKMDYLWYVNSAVLKSDLQSVAKTSTANTGQVFFANKANKYKVQITWYGTYQNVVLVSAAADLGIVDSCHNQQQNVNSQTTITNKDDYVIDTTVIDLSCDKGYIQPLPVTAASYKKTCSVNTDMIWNGCIGGNYLTDPNSMTTFSYEVSASDSTAYSSYLDESGYTTVHKNTNVSLACGKDSATGKEYTLREAWKGYVICDEADAAQCKPDGECVPGCPYKLNNHTTSTFVFGHNKEKLVADQDTITYECTTGTLTRSGADDYTAMCIGAKEDNTMQLDKCQSVVFVAPEIEPHINTVELTWADASWPLDPAQSSSAVLTLADGTAVQTVTGSSNRLVYYDLEPNTEYKVTLTLVWDAGKYTYSQQTFSTRAIIAVAAQTSRDLVELDVPFVPSKTPFEQYDIIVVNLGQNYNGTKDSKNFVYKYIASSSISKRDVEKVIIWIYPSEEEMWEADEEISAFILTSVPKDEVENQIWDLDLSEHRLDDGHNYLVIMRACETDTVSCIYGAASEYHVDVEWGVLISLCILVPIIIGLTILLIFLCFKTRLKYWRRTAMDYEEGQNEVYYRENEVPVEEHNSMTDVVYQNPQFKGY